MNGAMNRVPNYPQPLDGLTGFSSYVTSPALYKSVFILQDKTGHALRLFSINQPSYKNKAILTNPWESPILFCRLQAFGEDMGRRDKSETEHFKSERGKRERGMRERERRYSTRRNLWCRGTNQMVSERPEENCNIPAENTFSRALNSRDSR